MLLSNFQTFSDTFILCKINNEEWEKFQLKTIDNANHFSILVKNKEKILVPYSIRRSIFWAAHFPAHQGMSKLVEILKERHLYWPNMKKDIAEFLSTCIPAQSKKRTKQGRKVIRKIG